jgi:hypothetical protein
LCFQVLLGLLHGLAQIIIGSDCSTPQQKLVKASVSAMRDLPHQNLSK